MQPLSPDEYHRLREQAKRHAMELRREAVRDAQVWLARTLLRWVRKALRRAGARPRACATAFMPPPQETTAPCPPSF
ncbi:hypothetical protein [Acidovorax sp. M2(2025)]|uniref:hypothetical protein n=1 Tax=Acidovorax sp. M2(2025) TaxID=3411355 RepID=UPI003BF491A0